MTATVADPLIIKPEHGIDSMVKAVKNVLGRYADADGVRHFFNKSESRQHLIRMRFTTPDQIGIDLTLDMREVARHTERYLGSTVASLREKLNATRKARHDSPIIIH